MLLFVASVFALVALGQCGNYTVTDEAWFEVEVKDFYGKGDDFKGNFTIALFGDVAPMTVLNFISLTRGYKHGRSKLHYKGSPIHRIVPDFCIQGGDITRGDGTGGKSIYGNEFDDEEFLLSHRSDGWVAMANHGTDSNGSQFYIMLTKARWLDGKHVVFGKVVRGYSVVAQIGDVPANPDNAVPKKRVRFSDCGVTQLWEKRYDLTQEQLDSTEDLPLVAGAPVPVPVKTKAPPPPKKVKKEAPKAKKDTL